jgi:hypothetical protein
VDHARDVRLGAVLAELALRHHALHHQLHPDDRSHQAVNEVGRCVATALVWWADLAGHVVGERWVALADAWSAVVDVHHSAVVDVHAAMVAATVEGSFADDFWHGLIERVAERQPIVRRGEHAGTPSTVEPFEHPGDADRRDCGEQVEPHVVAGDRGHLQQRHHIRGQRLHHHSHWVARDRAHLMGWVDLTGWTTLAALRRLT